MLLGLKRVRLLDIPCGDMMYMSRFLDTRTDVDYTGIDIVPELIERHHKEFADKPTTFLHADILKMEKFEGGFDLILCRQMLQHLVTNDVLAVLARLSKSGSRYLLTTSQAYSKAILELNVNAVGRYRRLNLEAPPVALTAPLCYFRDGAPASHQRLMLWKLPLRQVVGCKATKLMKVNVYNASTDPYFYPYYACGEWSL